MRVFRSERKATLAISVTVSDVTQKRSGEFIHLMGKTRSMQRSGSGSEGISGTT